MKYPYSMGEAVGYSIVLLVSLWWLPVLGPMIIGYITGRKAGGPIKGLLAMMVPIALYFLIVQAIAIGWIHVPHIVNTYFTNTLASEVMVPYLRETISTGIAVGTDIMSYLYYAPSAFFIMLAFAFIGGAMSRQVILEKGIYPTGTTFKKASVRKKATVPEVKKADKGIAKKTAPKAIKAPKKEKGVKDLEKDGKFVVHEMDTRKVTPVKKKYGITFL